MHPTRGCVVWINGPPGVGKLTVARELRNLLLREGNTAAAGRCPPPERCSSNTDGGGGDGDGDGDGYGHDSLAGEPAWAPTARMHRRVLFGEASCTADGNDEDDGGDGDDDDTAGKGIAGSASPTTTTSSLGDIVILTDWQPATPSGHEAADSHRLAAHCSGRGFLPVYMTCSSRAEHRRRARSAGRAEAQWRWAAASTAASDGDNSPVCTLVVDGMVFEELLAMPRRRPAVRRPARGGALFTSSASSASSSPRSPSSPSPSVLEPSSLPFRWPGRGGLELDSAGMTARQAAGVILRRMQWDAVVAAAAVAPFVEEVESDDEKDADDEEEGGLLSLLPPPPPPPPSPPSSSPLPQQF